MGPRVPSIRDPSLADEPTDNDDYRRERQPKVDNVLMGVALRASSMPTSARHLVAEGLKSLLEREAECDVQKAMYNDIIAGIPIV